MPFWVPGSTPAISISPCVSWVKVKEWLQVMHSEHWTAALGMRQMKFSVGKPLDKLCRKLMALNSKQCRLVTAMVSGHSTLRQCLHIMALLDSAKYGKCGEKVESSYNTL
jgi:hypothetical protein